MSYEKVSKYHPDKIADRIAGALVDLAYSKDEAPKIAVEVLIGHGVCHIINETSTPLNLKWVEAIVQRIAGNVKVDYVEVPQDKELAANQRYEIKCGDNGIFLGVPLSSEETILAKLTQIFDKRFGSDGKYLIDDSIKQLVICQSNANNLDIEALLREEGFKDYKAKINPLGFWTGGTNVDTGATNRKLGSDLGQSVTGGGLMGKDFSKADVSVNIFCWLQAQERHEVVQGICAIGDSTVRINNIDVPYQTIVNCAKEYIASLGGFEKFAEYGLLR